MNVSTATERPAYMSHKTSSRQGIKANSPSAFPDHEVALMLLDLASQTMQASPPRTWVQSAYHPGSRRWLRGVLATVSELLRRPVGCSVDSGRRPAVVNAVSNAAEALGATGAWTNTPDEYRTHFANTLRVQQPHLPMTVIKIARSGAVPFSQQEMIRLQRRQGRP